MGKHSAPPRRTVLRSALGRVTARGISSVALGLLLILLARGTDPQSLGVLMTAYAIGLIVGAAAGFGMPVRVLRAPAERVGTAGMLYRVHTTVVCAVFAVAVAGSLALSVVATCGLLFAWGDTLLNYAQAHLVATGRDVAGNVLIVAIRVIPLVLVGAALAVTGSVPFWWLAVVLAIPVALGASVPRARRNVPSRWGGVRPSRGGGSAISGTRVRRWSGSCRSL